jgi:pimeloyl-ACP methyl ester carboxylesterase
MRRVVDVFDVAPGVRLAADAVGDPEAPPLLMLHGGGQTRHAWHATATSLAAAGWRAIAVDQRGHGESTHPRSPAYALDDFAADARALIAAIGDVPIVIGASLGGVAGLLALGEAPVAPAGGLVLVDVAHDFRSRGGERVVGFMRDHADGFASLADAAVSTYLPHRRRPDDVGGLRHNLRCIDGRWTWRWDPEILDTGHRLIGERASLSERLAAAATRLRKPCLLVRGTESDVLSAAIASEFVELAAGATLTEVPRAAHMVAGDNNDAFVAAISTWLRTSGARSGRDSTEDPTRDRA